MDADEYFDSPRIPAKESSRKKEAMAVVLKNKAKN
jgi:hypothetical protein